MNTIYDIQQLLKRFGTIIYTGNRIGDFDLMEMEMDDLAQMEFIEKSAYIQAKMILRKEKARLQQKQKEGRKLI